MRLSYLFNAVSLILIYIGSVAFIPIVIALSYQEYSSVLPFLITGLVSVILGCGFKFFVNRFLTKDTMTDIKKTEALAIVLLSWLVFSIIASVPYLFFGFGVIDSFFEGISGATTTGATIFTHYDYPHALFFWRSLTQWLGGMGIIVLFIAILPQFAIAGRQMFFAEAPGPTEDDKLTPRIKNTATALWGLYLVLTVVQIILLVLFKMPVFDAICNAFSTISTGGFSPNPHSIGGYNSIPICWIVIFFMILSGCNLALVYQVIAKFKYNLLWKNQEFKAYIGIILFVACSCAVVYFLNNDVINLKVFTDTVFSVVSVMTSTGFSTVDFTNWAVPALILLFAVMICGSSAGSTGGGIKVTRVLIALKYLRREIIKLLHPNAVITIKMENKTVSTDIVSQIIAFIIFFSAIFVINAVIVSIVENSVAIGICGSISTLGLVGPSLVHSIGPAGNFESLSSITKLIFMFNMLVGRLELVPFLILLNKDYWVFKK